MPKWDARFLRLAEHISAWSKDPSTKVGAVIADSANRVVSLGYNGFARGVADTPGRYADRETKLKFVVHAERNAILFAGRDLTGCTLYTWPFPPCAQCAAMVVQAGIGRVVYPVLNDQASRDRWGRWADDLTAAGRMFAEAGVTCEGVSLEPG
jgi:dCMP deaminase